MKKQSKMGQFLSGGRHDPANKTSSSSSSSNSKKSYDFVDGVKESSTPFFNPESMVGWISRGKRDATMTLNARGGGGTPLDTTNFYRGDPLRSRTKLDVIQRIKHAKKVMCVNDCTNRIVCWTCEREVSEHGWPAGLCIDEHIRKSPFISAFKAADTFLGYDTLNKLNKDLPTHLERHVNSPLHKKVELAIAMRYSALNYLPTHGINHELNSRTRHIQLNTQLRVRIQQMQAKKSQNSIEEEFLLLHELGVDIGNIGLGRKQSSPLAKLLSGTVASDMRTFLNAVNPFTGRKPWYSLMIDKYTTNSGITLLLSDIRCAIKGVATTLLMDVAGVGVGDEESDSEEEDEESDSEEEDEEEKEEKEKDKIGVNVFEIKESDHIVPTPEEEEGQEQKSVPAGGGLGQYRLLTGGSKIAPVGPKTISNFRRGRGMNSILLFGKEGEDVVENTEGNNAGSRLVSLVGDGAPDVQGPLNGLQHYMRGPNGLNQPLAYDFWDLAHQLQLLLKQLQKCMNQKYGNGYNRLYWLCRVAQQFIKQSPGRGQRYHRAANDLNALLMLRLKKVHQVRFLEDEGKAFRALLEMLPFIVLAMQQEIKRNKTDKKMGWEKLNQKWTKFVKRASQAKTVSWLAVLCDFNEIAMRLSKNLQSNVILAGDLEGIITTFYDEVEQTEHQSVPGGHVERLEGDKNFFEQGIYTNTQGVSMQTKVKWTGVAVQKRKSSLSNLRGFVATQFSTFKTNYIDVDQYHGDQIDSDDDDIFDNEDDILDNEDDDISDNEVDEMSENEVNIDAMDNLSGLRVPTSRTHILGGEGGGGLLVPPVVVHLAKLLNVDQMPSISDKKLTIPLDYGSEAISFLAKGKFKCVGVNVLTTEFMLFWKWCQRNYNHFVTKKKGIDVFDRLKLFEYLLTTASDGSHKFKNAKWVIEYNVAMGWQTAQTERDGSAINVLTTNCKNIQIGSLYDRMVICFNLPHW